MVQRDALVRHRLARPGQTHAVVVHTQLADVPAAIFQVECVHATPVEVRGLDEAFHHRVIIIKDFVAGGVIEALPEVSADAAQAGSADQVGRGVHEPVQGDGADGRVGFKGTEEGDERFLLLSVGGGRMVACHG